MIKKDKLLLESLIKKYNKKELIKEVETYKELSIEEALEKLDELADKYVPASGPADTIGGEILRAFIRLYYRCWNDGDVPYSGYGNITCNSSYRYLQKYGVLDGIKLTWDSDEWLKSLESITPYFYNWLTTGTGKYWFDSYNDFDSREASDEDRELERSEEYDEDDEW